MLLFFSWKNTASTSDTGFNPEECYSVKRGTHKLKSLQAVSRDYQVYFTDIEGNRHHLKEIFQSLFNNLVTEIETKLPDFSHRIRLVLNALSLNYPIHIPFHPACDFNIDLLLNKIERVLNSNENFDISDSVKVNILSVSLPVTGGYKLSGIQNRTVPDICSSVKQKKSIITIGKDKHFDLLYDRANYHVDVISSTKGLFMVRHYC